MKKFVSNGIIFLAGASIGAGATYLSVKKIFEAKADKEIKEMEDYYVKKHNELKEVEENKKVEEIKEDFPPEVKEEYNELASKYNTITKPKKTKKSKKKEIKPYVISATEYEDNNGFDKIILSYFEDDEVLMYQDETVMENANDVIGMVNLEQFGITGDGDDTVYIRNETFGADYQVVLEDGSYRNFIENQG